MPGFFKKKSEAELRQLNEKEIQKKLYGHYFVQKSAVGADDFESPVQTHSSVKAAADAQKNQTPSFFSEQSAAISNTIESEQKSAPKPVVSYERPKSESVQTSYTSSYKAESESKFSIPHLPWKLIGIAAASILVLALILTGLVKAARHPKSEPKRAEVVVPIKAEPAPVKAAPLSVPTPPVKAEKPTPAPTDVEELTPAETRDVLVKPIETGSKSYYSIQICTYRTEADAEKLVTRLDGLGLPARFVATRGRGEGSTFYLVLVGKDESYTEAQTRFAKFKELSVWNEFPDAFVRKGS